MPKTHGPQDTCKASPRPPPILQPRSPQDLRPKGFSAKNGIKLAAYVYTIAAALWPAR